MKKLLFLLVPIVCLLSGCYDDSKVWEELNSQSAKITALETLTSTMNNNINSLQSITSALQGNVTINSVTATDNGYVISFSDGKSATIKNGADAETPKFGAKADTDGAYYWTLNGEWLKDASGNKVPTGVTPKIKIENDQWQVSYDNGKTYSKIDGQGAAITCIFESVTTDANYATFTLSDGSVITVPLTNTAAKLQLTFDESVFAEMHDGELISTTYTITAPEGAKVDFQTFESDGWKVTIYPANEKEGRFSVKSPEKAAPTKILFMLTDDKGGSFLKILNIGYSEEAKPFIKTEYVVDPNGGELVIPVNSCTATLSEGAEGWVEIADVGDKVVLNFTSNEGYDYRSTQLTLEDGTVISITQLERDALILSQSVVNIDGKRQKVNFIAKANVTVKAEVTEGSDWLKVSPATRGLTDRLFTFTVSRNNTGEERTAKVVFTGGSDLSETCTVIQAPYEGSPAIDVSEAIATEEGEEVELNPSLVVALTSDGYMVADAETAILVTDGTNGPAIGDSVKFDALTGVLNGISTLESVENFTTSSTGNKVAYPQAQDITKSVDSFESEVPAYVTVTGDLTISGGVYNLAVSGATTKVEIYNPAYSTGLHSLDGHNVKVTGYWYGKTDGKASIIAVNSKDNGSSIQEGTQVTVSEFIKLAKEDMKLKLKGTVSNFNSNYCSFDLTDETGTIYVYSVSNKSDWSGKISNGGTVELLGYYKNYNSKDEVVNAEILSFTGGEQGGGGEDATPISVADFIAAQKSTTQPYKLTGTVSNIKSEVYGNFDLTDETGTVYIYGLVSKDLGGYSANKANDKSFSSIGIKEGDKITIVTYRDDYTNSSTGITTIEGVGGYYVSGASGGGSGSGGEGGGSSDVTGNTETIDFSAQGYSNAQAIDSFAGSVVTLTFDKGTNSNSPKYYTTGTAIRLYGSNTMTVSAKGKTIVGITLTFGSGDQTNEITADTGSYKDGSWTGSASSVTFTIGGTTGHRRVKSVAVTFAD